jgi:hypothetical protein
LEKGNDNFLREDDTQLPKRKKTSVTKAILLIEADSILPINAKKNGVLAGYLRTP